MKLCGQRQNFGFILNINEQSKFNITHIFNGSFHNHNYGKFHKKKSNICSVEVQDDWMVLCCKLKSIQIISTEMFDKPLIFNI